MYATSIQVGSTKGGGSIQPGLAVGPKAYTPGPQALQSGRRVQDAPEAPTERPEEQAQIMRHVLLAFASIDAPGTILRLPYERGG